MLVLVVNMILIYNFGDIVNSIGRIFRKEIIGFEARNSLSLGLLAFGNGWHANYNKFPRRVWHKISKQFHSIII